jgi:hypothetical protein
MSDRVILTDIELNALESLTTNGEYHKTTFVDSIKMIIASHRAVQHDRDEIKRKYDVISDSADNRQCCELREKAKQERDELKRELDAYRTGGLTEEILRRHDGFLKVGNGCVVVRADDWETLKRQVEELQSIISGYHDETMRRVRRANEQEAP